jgi:hypothetical protein
MSNERCSQETFVGNDYEDDFLLQDFMIPLQHVADAVKLRKIKKQQQQSINQ